MQNQPYKISEVGVICEVGLTKLASKDKTQPNS
jgi:hypothetical protein